MKSFFHLTIACILAIACNREEISNIENEIYFPPSNSEEWATTSIDELDWDAEALSDLLNFLEESDSRGFIILKDGKIVVEEYWNKTLLGLTFGDQSSWYWASAAKTLTSFLVGIAEQEEKIDLEEKSSTYLGSGWSSLTQEQEDEITVKHHLTMTTGLDDTMGASDCTDKACLNYLTDPGTRWAYHNAPYTILDKIIEGASGEDFDTYFDRNISDPIGMSGYWTYQGYNHLYISNLRSMARFGLLISNEGMWNETKIIDNDDFLSASINSSQEINPSYGYLWWLNGKESYMLPQLQESFDGFLSPNAPSDMYAAMGKNGQFINIVPSENLVIVRMGGNPDDSLVPTAFQNNVWEKLRRVIDN